VVLSAPFAALGLCLFHSDLTSYFKNHSKTMSKIATQKNRAPETKSAKSASRLKKKPAGIFTAARTDAAIKAAW